MKRNRIIIVLLFFLVCFLGILIRLFYWQVMRHEKLSGLAEEQHFVNLIIPSKRGDILASDQTPLATNEQAYLLYADIRNFNKNKKEIVEKITPLIFQEEINKLKLSPKDRSEFLDNKEKILTAALNQKNIVWVPLAHKLSLKTKTALEGKNFSGLGFEDEDKRYYPEGSSSAHLLGFVGKDSLGYDQGYFGLEGQYDLMLKGKEGKKILEKDALGRPIIFGNQEIYESREGRTLVTTIDKYIQYQSDKYLQEGMKTWDARAGNVIVANPQTGAILAMASYPNYDPADFAGYASDLYKNPGINDVFEPGSIMKPVIMSMALEEGKVKPTSRCPVCSGPRVIGEYTIRTFNNQYHPNLTMTQVLENSDNTGMVYIGELLGKKTIYNYLQKYEFGNLTGIDLQEEETGTIKPLSQWYPIDAATINFGQGIAVTPIQMVRAFNVIANGGRLLKPYIVEEELENNGKKINVAPKDSKIIISKETANILTEMLVSVTEKSPLHFPKERTPQLNNYRIAAKSGTAQIPIYGSYDPNKTIGSVIGFAPVNKPRFLVYVRLVEPAVRPWGSDTAGPIFFKIMADLLLHFGIPPD